MEIVFDERFEELFELVQKEGEVPLRDLTDWEWDRVSVFFEGDKTSLIVEEVGTSLGAVTDGERLLSVRGNLLVFQMDGDVTKIIGTINPQIHVNYPLNERRSYTGEVIAISDPRGYANCIFLDDESPVVDT